MNRKLTANKKYLVYVSITADAAHPKNVQWTVVGEYDIFIHFRSCKTVMDQINSEHIIVV